jgi:hypothetical protein
MSTEPKKSASHEYPVEGVINSSGAVNRADDEMEEQPRDVTAEEPEEQAVADSAPHTKRPKLSGFEEVDPSSAFAGASLLLLRAASAAARRGAGHDILNRSDDDVAAEAAAATAAATENPSHPSSVTSPGRNPKRSGFMTFTGMKDPRIGPEYQVANLPIPALWRSTISPTDSQADSKE